MSTPQQLETLRDLLDTAAPLVVIETHDERRVLALFEAFAKTQPDREVWTWSASRGLRVAHNLKLRLTELRASDGDADDAKATRQLPDALEALDKLHERSVVLLLDVHPYLGNPLIVRALKEVALRGEGKGAGHALQLMLIGHDIKLPDELAPFTARFDIEPMTLDRVRELFDQELLRQQRLKGKEVVGLRSTLDSLLRQMVGMPEPSVRHLARIVLSDGQVTTPDLARVMAIKAEMSGAAELLAFEHRLPSLDEVAGMRKLKRWLTARRAPFVDPQGSGLPPPRGVLLLGVQGAGKSMAAKAIAASWQVPLFRMDFGALFDKYQGESERKLREALRVADAMQPCIVWMDEIEKGLASGQDGTDSLGTGQRLLGTLLTWMSERQASVFLVATANDVQKLPPELIRKGRFDEIFFVDLPGDLVRDGIFRLHMGKRRIAVDEALMPALVSASSGFSGAEIEAAIVAACYEAHGQQRAPDAQAVAGELALTKPLSVTRAESIDALRAWAAGRAVPVD
jgi:ATPase family associated with various cellular activities (AAA)